MAAHLTNFSFEFIYAIFTEDASLPFLYHGAKKSKNDQKLKSRGFFLTNGVLDCLSHPSSSFLFFVLLYSLPSPPPKKKKIEKYKLVQAPEKIIGSHGIISTCIHTCNLFGFGLMSIGEKRFLRDTLQELESDPNYRLGIHIITAAMEMRLMVPENDNGKFSYNKISEYYTRPGGLRVKYLPDDSLKTGAYRRRNLPGKYSISIHNGDYWSRWHLIYVDSNDYCGCENFDWRGKSIEFSHFCVKQWPIYKAWPGMGVSATVVFIMFVPGLSCDLSKFSDNFTTFLRL